MNIAFLPLPIAFFLTLYSYGRLGIFKFGNFMYYIGVISSVLTNAAIFGIPMLLTSPVMIIYTMINVISSTSTWAALESSQTVSYALLGYFNYVLMFFEAHYHDATGFSSVLVYTLIKSLGTSLNLGAMSTTASDAQYTAGRNSFTSYLGTGIWLGTFLGALTILPATILGIITLPINATITLVKVID